MLNNQLTQDSRKIKTQTKVFFLFALLLSLVMGVISGNNIIALNQEQLQEQLVETSEGLFLAERLNVEKEQIPCPGKIIILKETYAILKNNDKDSKITDCRMTSEVKRQVEYNFMGEGISFGFLITTSFGLIFWLTYVNLQN